MFATHDLLYFINITVFRFYSKNNLNIIEHCIIYIKETVMYKRKVCLLCTKQEVGEFKIIF